MDTDRTPTKKKLLYGIISLILEFLPTMTTVTIAAITLSAAISGSAEAYPQSEGEHLRHVSGFVRLGLKFVLIMCASKYLGFCELHRAQIIYCYIFYVLRLINRFYGLGNVTIPLLWLTGISGTILLAYIVYKIIRKHYGRHYKIFYTGNSGAARHWRIVSRHLRKNRD